MWFITFSTHRRKPVFEDTELFALCVEAFREVCSRQDYKVYALAIMADHVHLILDADSSGHAASKVLNNLKGVASRRIFQAYPELKLDLQSTHLWTLGYFVQPVTTRQSFRAMKRYVEQNPVKLGLPQQHYDWVLGEENSVQHRQD